MIQDPPGLGSLWEVSFTYIVMPVEDIVYLSSTSHCVFKWSHGPVAFVIRIVWPFAKPCGAEHAMVLGPPAGLATTVAVPHCRSSRIAWPKTGNEHGMKTIKLFVDLHLNLTTRKGYGALYIMKLPKAGACQGKAILNKWHLQCYVRVFFAAKSEQRYLNVARAKRVYSPSKVQGNFPCPLLFALTYRKLLGSPQIAAFLIRGREEAGRAGTHDFVSVQCHRASQRQGSAAYFDAVTQGDAHLRYQVADESGGGPQSCGAANLPEHSTGMGAWVFHSYGRSARRR
jgi:hypothetical protein